MNGKRFSLVAMLTLSLPLHAPSAKSCTSGMVAADGCGMVVVIFLLLNVQKNSRGPTARGRIASRLPYGFAADMRTTRSSQFSPFFASSRVFPPSSLPLGPTL